MNIPRNFHFSPRAFAAALALATTTAGCVLDGDATESSDLGDGAVFADTDGSVIVYRRLTKDGVGFAALFRVDPVTEQQTFIGDVTELSFEADIFLAESGFAFHHLDRFFLYGRDGKKIAEKPASDFIVDVKLSGDRGFLLGTVDKTSGKRIAVVDGETLDIHELEATSGIIAGASFAHTSDALYLGYFETASGKGHLLRWDLDAVKKGGFAIDPATGLFTAPNLDVELGITIPTAGDVVVSPNDKLVSVAGLGIDQPLTGRPTLDVVDILSGAVRRVGNANQPVTFTFDEAYLIYADGMPGALMSLELGDSASTGKALGVASDHDHAISKTSHHIVETWDDTVSGIPLVGAVRTPLVGDFDLGFHVSLPGAKMYNVTRPLSGASVLQSLDLATGKATKPIAGDFAGMTLLPSGSVILTDVTAKTISVVDPDTDTVKKTLPLPTLN